MNRISRTTSHESNYGLDATGITVTFSYHRDQVDVGNQDASSLHAENADRMDHVRAGSGNPKDPTANNK